MRAFLFVVSFSIREIAHISLPRIHLDGKLTGKQVKSEKFTTIYQPLELSLSVRSMRLTSASFSIWSITCCVQTLHIFIERSLARPLKITCLKCARKVARIEHMMDNQWKYASFCLSAIAEKK